MGATIKLILLNLTRYWATSIIPIGKIDWHVESLLKLDRIGFKCHLLTLKILSYIIKNHRKNLIIIAISSLSLLVIAILGVGGYYLADKALMAQILAKFQPETKFSQLTTNLSNPASDNLKSDNLKSDNLKSDNLKSDNLKSDNLKSDKPKSDSPNSRIAKQNTPAPK